MLGYIFQTLTKDKNMKKILLLIICLTTITLSLVAETVKSTTLEAEIELFAADPARENPKIIQPGTPLVISVTIKNSGNEKNEQGYFFVRFAYPNPLASNPKAELFVTEKIPLPPIEPGKEATIAFNTVHHLPSLFDFIRQDYGMRQYLAVAVIDQKEYILGNATLTFSAYYYAGPNHEMQTAVPAVAH